MGLPLWKHAHLLRRFSEPTCSGGYAVSTYEDMYIMANIQTPSRTTSTAGDGDYPYQTIKVFTESQINTADDRTGTPADWIWFQDKWFECRTSRHSNDTFLHHWTAEFVECATQADAPNEDDETEEAASDSTSEDEDETTDSTDEETSADTSDTEDEA